MTLHLRPYQRAAIDAIYEYFAAATGHPLLVLPTASGKSLVAAAFIQVVILHALVRDGRPWRAPQSA
jgi:DNA repair protein RadD